MVYHWVKNDMSVFIYFSSKHNSEKIKQLVADLLDNKPDIVPDGYKLIVMQSSEIEDQYKVKVTTIFPTEGGAPESSVDTYIRLHRS